MTLQDLSIGDWIQHDINDPRHDGQLITVPVQVRGMFTDSAGQGNIIYFHPIDRIEVCSLSHQFEPLPISHELVEGCGAILVEVGDNGPATPQNFRNRFERWDISSLKKEYTLWYDRRTKKWTVAGANQVYLDYCHQLQHILRLLAIPLELNPQKVFTSWI